MEKRIIVLLLCFLCFLSQGCVSDSAYKFTPEVMTDKNQSLIEREAGVKAVISHAKTASVFIRPMADIYLPEDNPVIVIGISGERELKISPEDIQAFVDGKPHKILDHDELLADIKDRHEVAVEGLKNQYKARTQQVAGSSVKDANDPAVFEPNPGRRNEVGSTEKYGYKIDSKGMSEGIAEAEKEMQSAKEALNRKTIEEVNALNSTFLLKETTIKPNEWYRGQIKLAKIPDPGKPHTVRLVVTVAGKEHQFEIKTSANK